MLRAAAVSSPGTGIAVIVGRIGCRSSTACSVTVMCRPIAVEVFEGDVGDPSTLSAQISQLKQRFGLKHVILVGDRGMITSARIRQDLQPAGLLASWLVVENRSWPAVLGRRV